MYVPVTAVDGNDVSENIPPNKTNIKFVLLTFNILRYNLIFCY